MLIRMKETYNRYFYEKAPIKEAIFEVNFSTEIAEDEAITLPGQFFNKISHEYPVRKKLVLDPNPYAQIPRTKDLTVLQAWNETHTKCLQFSPEIIAANDTAYKNWETFVPMINLLLRSYLDCVNPVSTNKIGFRTINRFLIPGKYVVIPEYFQINLALPPTLQTQGGFNINVFKQTIYNDTQCNAQIRFASDVLKPNESGFAFILDLDVFTINDLTTDIKDISKKASDCHDFLKLIFEEFLLDQTRAILGIKK